MSARAGLDAALGQLSDAARLTHAALADINTALALAIRAARPFQWLKSEAQTAELEKEKIVKMMNKKRKEEEQAKKLIKSHEKARTEREEAEGRLDAARKKASAIEKELAAEANRGGSTKLQSYAKGFWDAVEACAKEKERTTPPDLRGCAQQVRSILSAERVGSARQLGRNPSFDLFT